MIKLQMDKHQRKYTTIKKNEKYGKFHNEQKHQRKNI